MRYYMQYLKTANVNLVKDMGMIPYKLHKLYKYDSTVVTYNHGEYSYLDNEVKGLKIDFVKKYFHSFSFDGSVYLLKKSKQIDFLQIFHITLSSIFYTYTYKLLNPKGKIYLKLDCSYKLVDRLNNLSFIERLLINNFLMKIDLISVEQKELYYELQEKFINFKGKLINIPNGVDFKDLCSKKIYNDFSQKENIILNVARIGAEEKNTPMLLEAFSKIKDIELKDWKLVLIGPIEEKFDQFINEYFQRNPQLKNKVIFKGNIQDRYEIFKEYSKAKIFSLTSEFESFGIAFIEAAALGNIIVATDVGIAKELTIENNGKLVQPNDVEGLTAAFNEYINMKDEELMKLSNKTYELCKNNFDWDEIIKKLHSYIQKC